MRVKPGLRVLRWTAVACLLLLMAGPAAAKDLRITINRHTKPTPVQKLNREGVAAIEKHDYKKAKSLFYKAYLLDPNDPFTLNNLGYIAELEGNVDRAQRYYALAAEQGSDALVAQATTDTVLGKPVAKIAGNAEEQGMQVNRMNVSAIGLLQKDRAPEADIVLHRALALDPHNPFTLNNLGFAEEKQGEWEKALGFYNEAANVGSSDPVMVTINPAWRGRPISEIAADNAAKLRKAMARSETLRERVARLNLRGVSALNRNQRREAKEYFQEAYRLAPNDAFTLNNMGYLAEMDGDRETANFYYEKAAEAKRADTRVDVATRREAEGQKLSSVARESDSSVQEKMAEQLAVKRQQGGPIVLKRRDNTPVTEAAPPQPNSGARPGIAAPTTQESTPENAAPANPAIEGPPTTRH
jgi:Flp pilus assembly protein TadD